MKKYLYALVVVCGLAVSSLVLADQPMAMTPEKMAAIRHANPMPNLMMIVVKHEKELGLSDEQKAALAAWRKEAQPKMMEMVRTVVNLEKQIHDAALAGASGAVLQQLASKMFNVRGAIIKQKLACRNNMARILGMEKMKKVIELYKAETGAGPAET